MTPFARLFGLFLSLVALSSTSEAQSSDAITQLVGYLNKHSKASSTDGVEAAFDHAATANGCLLRYYAMRSLTGSPPDASEYDLDLSLASPTISEKAHPSARPLYIIAVATRSDQVTFDRPTSASSGSGKVSSVDFVVQNKPAADTLYTIFSAAIRACDKSVQSSNPLANAKIAKSPDDRSERWVLIAKMDSGTSIFVDTTTIARVSRTVLRVWTKMVFRVSPEVNAAYGNVAPGSTLLHEEFDCAARTLTRIGVVAYSANGTQTMNTEFRGQPMEASPESVEEMELNFVCKRRR
jgi:hypothetical protein